MNTARNSNPTASPLKTTDSKTHIYLVNSQNKEEIKEARKMTKEDLNEKLYYFYNNGGPIMDI